MLETMLNGSPVEVSSLDAEWLLDLAADAEVRERQAGRAKLRVAAQWCVLHPATAESGFVTWSDTGLPGLCRDEDEALGGEGTPLVAAFTPEPFAAALGVSTLTGLQLLADALDLQHRLPRIWAAVEALAVAPWKARKIAQATHHLSQAAAASVDAPARGPDRVVWVAGHRDRGRPGHRHLRPAPAGDPGASRARTPGGCGCFHRGVGTDGADDWAGTSHLEVTGDTLDLTTFHDLVCEQAAQLKALGDTDTLEVRKAKAVGVIANRQAALDLGTLLGPDEPVTSRDRPSRRRLRPRPSSTSTCRLTDLLGLDGSDGSDGPGSGPWRGSGRPPSPGSRTGPAGPGSPSNPSSTWPAPTPSTRTTRPRGCGNWSSSATGTASSRGAPGTPEPATWTTSPRTRRTAHPARPGPTPSPPSADDTTGRRPSGDGATTAPRPATTNGPDPKARPTWSPRTGTIPIPPN